MKFFNDLRRALGRNTPAFTRAPEKFGAFTQEHQRDLDNYRIVSFLEARIAELEDIDPDGAAKCRKAIDDCCELIDGSGADFKPYWLRGAVKDMKTLKKLARNWSDHYGFMPEWADD